MRKELGERHSKQREEKMHRPRGGNKLGVFKEQKQDLCGQREREGRVGGDDTGDTGRGQMMHRQPCRPWSGVLILL